MRKGKFCNWNTERNTLYNVDAYVLESDRYKNTFLAFGDDTAVLIYRLRYLTWPLYETDEAVKLVERYEPHVAEELREAWEMVKDMRLAEVEYWKREGHHRSKTMAALWYGAEEVDYEKLT